MNLELSLPLIWLVVFDVVAIMVLLAGAIGHREPRSCARPHGALTRRCACARSFMFAQTNGVSLAALFPLYATLSIFWSPNPLRALLTAAIIWLLFCAILAIIFLTPRLQPDNNFRQKWLKIFFITSAIVCVVCWLQAIFDVLGIDREATLLCRGCVAQTFGFPHPSGFAIEPQFMGNLLLAPTLMMLFGIAYSSGRTYAAFFFVTTLFLTFSRGAIYAFAIALIVLVIFALKNRQFRLSLLAIPVAAFIFTLTAQGIFTVVGPTHGSFTSGVAKSIHHLSLGIIDFRPQTPQNAPGATSDSNPLSYQAQAESGLKTPQNSPQPPIFDGYVAESTNVRLSLNAIALETWRQSPSTVLFGVGLGGAGTAMHAAFPTEVASSKEIVQNQPISLLLELGVIGVALAIGGIWQFLALLFETIRSATSEVEATRARNDEPRERRVSTEQRQGIAAVATLLIAYFITLQFFSGLGNALHIYLLPPMLCIVLSNVNWALPEKKAHCTH